MAKMAKKVRPEEHADEAWLLPYADMLTLLLALFIVMFAMSKADQEKTAQLSEQFKVIFSGGQSAIFDQPGSSVIPSTDIDYTSLEEDTMKNIKQALDEKIREDGYEDKVNVVIDSEGLAISIQDTVLFASGNDKLLNQTSPLLLDVSKMLADLENEIKIVGHTDNVPISNQRFNSNWELSAMRAINVMNFLVKSGGVKPNNLSIQGYGEYKPKFDNSSEDGRANNRRVEILVVRKYPSSANEDKTAIQDTNTNIKDKQN